jgi:hypothetical protein
VGQSTNERKSRTDFLRRLRIRLKENGVEEHVLPLVAALNANGIVTESSCEGHVGKPFTRPWPSVTVSPRFAPDLTAASTLVYRIEEAFADVGFAALDVSNFTSGRRPSAHRHSEHLPTQQRQMYIDCVGSAYEALPGVASFKAEHACAICARLREYMTILDGARRRARAHFSDGRYRLAFEQKIDHILIRPVCVEGKLIKCEHLELKEREEVLQQTRRLCVKAAEALIETYFTDELFCGFMPTRMMPGGH